MNIILNECKKILTDYYGNKLKGIILYGSEARKQSSDTSDIDILILKDSGFEYSTKYLVFMGAPAVGWSCWPHFVNSRSI